MTALDHHRILKPSRIAGHPIPEALG